MGIEERSTLVFASGIGRIKEEKQKPVRPQGDGVVRISLKRLGGGKMVSLVSAPWRALVDDEACLYFPTMGLCL